MRIALLLAALWVPGRLREDSADDSEYGGAK
jgi:hypothetical protein